MLGILSGNEFCCHFTEEKSCDSDDSLGLGGRGRSGSKISQTSRVEREDSTDEQYDSKRRKASNGSVALEVMYR